jgi:N-acetylglutamate synthase-like GNAT family acetyltransferase
VKVFTRQYDPAKDYQKISEFLTRHFHPGNADGNWLEPTWEYANFHPALDVDHMNHWQIWETDYEIVAFAHYEWHMGEGFFQFHPEFRHLREEMLVFAEKFLTGVSSKDGRKYLLAYVNDYDEKLLNLLTIRGYQRKPDEIRPLFRFEITDLFPDINLPDGFRLTSLADECDWSKVHRVMWRGFNHPGDPPSGEEELLSRQKMFDTPKARRDLKIAVKAPNGDFVAFCGMFYDDNNQFAYVEPVATDPDYRRLGLGKAAVLEGIRRCAELGAKEAFVGSDQLFYQAIGFRKVFNTECWVKYFNEVEKDRV